MRHAIVPGRPHNHSTYRVRSAKTFQFVQDIWQEFVRALHVEHREIDNIHDIFGSEEARYSSSESDDSDNGDDD